MVTGHDAYATQFVIGSVLFLIGGLFNYRRAHLVIKGERIADELTERA